MLTFSHHFYFPGLWTTFGLFSPPLLPIAFTVHRVKRSHCSSLFQKSLLSQAPGLSAMIKRHIRLSFLHDFWGNPPGFDPRPSSARSTRGKPLDHRVNRGIHTYTLCILYMYMKCVHRQSRIASGRLPKPRNKRRERPKWSGCPVRDESTVNVPYPALVLCRKVSQDALVRIS